jgi:hypothetical protein
MQIVTKTMHPAQTGSALSRLAASGTSWQAWAEHLLQLISWDRAISQDNILQVLCAIIFQPRRGAH